MNLKIFACILLTPFLIITHCGDVSARKLNIAMVLWRGETMAEKGFREAVGRHGYQVTYHIINANQDRNQLAKILRKSLHPLINEIDYVYSFGTTASLMVSHFLNNRVPQIFNVVASPEKSSLKTSKTADNKISGVTNRISLSLQMQTIRKIKPIKTLGFLFNPREENSVFMREEMRQLGESMGFKVIDLRCPPVKGFLQKHLNELSQNPNRFDAIYLPLDSYIVSKAEIIGHTLRKAKIFSIGAQREYIDKGILIGLIADYYHLGVLSADILHRHQGGEQMRDIPIQSVSEPLLIINHTTQKALSIRIDDDIANQAIFID